MTIYLIDYENVSEKGLEGYFGLQPEDRVIVFFNPSLNPKIPIAAVRALGGRLQFHDVQKAGKNYLDIYLTACLGRMSVQHPEASFVIVSHDQDYVPAMDFCGREGVDVRLVKNIAQALTASMKPVEPEKTEKAVKPTEPAVPEKTEKAVKPTEPAVPEKTEKAVKPAEPVVPEQPVKTVKGEKTVKTVKQNKPAKQEKTAKSEKAAKPVKPEKPAKTEKAVRTRKK